MTENIIEAELVPMGTDPGSAMALARADLDVQITTAKSYPRDARGFLARAIEWATLDVATAESMIYEKPVAGGAVRGPSIRLAEIVQQAYGNLRVASRLIAVQQKHITVEAVAHDLEANTAFRAEVVSSIWQSKYNKRYSEDVIQSTILAAQAKARRNAILAIVPGVFVTSILKEVEALIAGQSSKSDLKERVEKMMGYWSRYRVTEKEVLDFLGITNKGEITADHLVTLRSKAEDLEQGASLDTLFVKRRTQPKEQPAQDPPKGAAAAVAEALSSTPKEPSSPSSSENPASSEPASSTPSPATSSETTRQRARRLAKQAVADKRVKTQREIFDKLHGLCEAQADESDEDILDTVCNDTPPAEPEPTPEEKQEQADDLPDIRFDDVPEEALDEKIGEWEDKVSEKDVEGLSRAQAKVPGVMEDGATPATLKDYLRALDDELQ